MNNLEDIVNEMERLSAVKLEKEVKQAEAYHGDYVQGIEDLYKFIRQKQMEKRMDELKRR